MEKLRVKFVDFWTDINQAEGNFFYQLLSKTFDVEFSEDPEIIFYSNYGKEYLKYKCIRIFFSGENMRPDFKAADYAITFDHIDKKRHFRFPLWVLYYKSHIHYGLIKTANSKCTEQELSETWRNKKKFCCFVVSNSSCKKRNDFFKSLSEVRHVDSAGKYLNNIGYFLEGGSERKLDFIRDYKFVISFENSSHPGYTTEKILEPFLVNAIPIYWGDPLVARDFNNKRFINYSDFKTEKEIIEHILEIDANDLLALDILKEEYFANGSETIKNFENGLNDFLLKIVADRHHIKPVSQNKLLSFYQWTNTIVKKFKNRILRSAGIKNIFTK